MIAGSKIVAFGGGHALGNLPLAALWDRDQDPIAGLDCVGQLLKVVGRVLPMSREPLEIQGRLRTWEGAQVVRGQKEVALARGELEELTLIPENTKPTEEGLRAIADADFLTICPGSWFSSVMPHLIIAPQRKAICELKARKILILNWPANVTNPPKSWVTLGQPIILKLFALLHLISNVILLSRIR